MGGSHQLRKPPMEDSVRVRLSGPDREKVSQLADARGLSLSGYVRQVLRRHLALLEAE
jgi:predicted DNA binding CopG/RHH family protein